MKYKVLIATTPYELSDKLNKHPDWKLISQVIIFDDKLVAFLENDE